MLLWLAIRNSQTSGPAIPELRNGRKIGAARLFSLVLNLGFDLAFAAVIAGAALRLLTRRCLRGDTLVCLDPVRPGSIGVAQGTSAIAAVPGDQANERNDVSGDCH